MQRFFGLSCAFLSVIPIIGSAEPVSVEGVVTDRARQPIPGSTVRLIHERPAYHVPEDMLPLAESQSDTKGRFVLSADVPATAPLSILASAPGHRLARFPIDRRQMGRLVGLALEPGTVIEGRVTDRDGQPVADALLGPLAATLETERVVAQRIVPQWTRSASDGTFRFEGLLPGVEHRFLVRAEGYEVADITLPSGSRDVSFRLHPGGSEIRGEVNARGSDPASFASTKVRLNGNGFDLVVLADAAGQFRLSGIPPGHYSLEALPEDRRASRVAQVTLPEGAGTSWSLEVSSGYTVSGMAVDTETSTPASNLPLRVKVADSEPFPVVTGSDGRFTAGPFFLAGAPQAEVPAETGFVSPAALGEAIESPEPASGFRDVTDMRVPVRRKRLLALDLENFDQTTQPVLLTLLSPPGPDSRPQRNSVTSPTAEIPVYSAGAYSLWGMSGGLSTGLHQIHVGEESRIPVPLRLSPAPAVSGRVTVQTADGVTTRPAGHRIRLLAARETTAGVSSEAPPVGSVLEQQELARRTIAEIPSLAPDGSYSFPALPSGRVVVLAENKRGTRRLEKQLLLEPGSASTADFVFEPGKDLSGTVLTGENTPVVAATVKVRLSGGAAGEGREITLEADERGQFRAEDLEADVAESLYVDFHGFMPRRLGPLTLPATGVQIVLQKRGLLRARVEDSRLSRWQIFLMSAEPWRRGTHPEQLMSRPVEPGVAVMGGEDAEFRVPGAGHFRVVGVGEEGRLAVSDPFTWAPGDDTDREIIVTPGTGSMRGTFDGTGEAEVTAWNTALPEQPGVKAEYKAQASGGTFSLDALPPGDYLVIASGDSVYASAPNVQVTAGGTASVRLESDTGGAPVKGIVRMAGEPLAGVELELVSQTDPTAPVRRTLSSREGTFEFETVPADEYLVRGTLKSEAGEVKEQKAVTVPRRGDAPIVDLNLQPGMVTIVPAAQLSALGITAGSDVFFLNKESRDLIKGERTSGGDVRVELKPGTYEVWRGDEAVGTALLAADGQIELKSGSGGGGGGE